MAKKTSKKKIVRKKAVDTAPAPELRLAPPPIGLGQVLGQVRAVEALRAAIATDRLHHAWIFSGPGGVGKFTTAMAFAAVILDASSEPNLSGVIEPDPDSNVQHLLGAGSHPDLHIIVKELARFSDDRATRERKLITIPLDVVRQRMLGPAYLASNLVGGRASKVFIVDEAHLLNAATQNAVLKTMEEPPEGTIIILVTDSEERLLPTIRSRSQRVAFNPLDDRAMQAWLSTSYVEVPTGDSGWLMRYASGSPGTVKRALEGGLGRWHATIGPMLDRIARGEYVFEFGPVLAELIEERAVAVVAKNKQASKDAAKKAAIGEMFRLIAERFREELRAGKSEQAADAIDALREAERELWANVQLPFVAEQLSETLSASMR